VLKNIKTRAVWLAIGIVFGGSALSFAGVAATSSHSPTPKPSVSKSPEAHESEAAEPADADQNNGANEQRPLNHGFYVSQAAHCKDVLTFTAPTNCATDGHGAYVSSVAGSDAGKGAHGNSHADSHSKKP